MSSLSGKIALVTGASRGIGQAIALRLGREGAIVLGTATSQAGAEAITAKLKEHHYAGQGFVLDVTRVDSVEALLSEVQTAYGAPLILVNNAGITADNLLLRMKEEEWQQVINTNLTSVYRLSKLALKAMLKVRWGRIISISSVVGVSGAGGQANYAAAKAGVIAFSKSLAQEVASRNITVNVVAPGMITTDMTQALSAEQRESMVKMIPMARAGTPEEIAASVAFLASDEASYITGVTLHVNGGVYMA